MDSEGHGVVLWTVARFLGLRSSEVSAFSKLWVMVAGFDVLKWLTAYFSPQNSDPLQTQRPSSHCSFFHTRQNFQWVGGLEHRFTNNPNFKPL